MNHPATSAQERFAWIALAAALVAYPLLLWRYIEANSATFDEAQHLTAAYSYWHCGDYGVNPEHPPLVKLVAGIPLRSRRLATFAGGCSSVIRTGKTAAESKMDEMAVAYRVMNEPDAVELLTSARRGLLVFPLLLLLTVFFTARAWFGPMAAGWAVLLTLLDPNLTAHSVLLTTDVPLTAATLLSLLCAWRFCRGPHWTTVLCLGLALGLALAVKHSGVLVPIVALLECAVYALSTHGARIRLLTKLSAGWIAACVVAIVVLWSVYQFRFAALPGAPALGVAAVVEESGMAHGFFGRLVDFLAAHRLLPEAYLDGFVYVLHNTSKSTYTFSGVTRRP